MQKLFIPCRFLLTVNYGCRESVNSIQSHAFIDSFLVFKIKPIVFSRIITMVLDRDNISKTLIDNLIERRRIRRTRATTHISKLFYQHRALLCLYVNRTQMCSNRKK